MMVKIKLTLNSEDLQRLAISVKKRFGEITTVLYDPELKILNASHWMTLDNDADALIHEYIMGFLAGINEKKGD